ncbi:MAG: hypothetical protein RDU25_00915 [Patescibacteria group bacterium]|nr:hypothetical protein [Patescibacteria group bacterium]
MLTIYYHPLDSAGKPTGQTIPVRLLEDGSADISGLPMQLQNTLRSMGTPDELHHEFLKPQDGERFLLSLVRNSNGYNNFSLQTGEKK